MQKKCLEITGNVSIAYIFIIFTKRTCLYISISFSSSEDVDVDSLPAKEAIEYLIARKK